MTALIAILIALLGYGTPADFSHMTENELQHEISALEDGGHGTDWDHAGVNTPNDGE